MKNRLFYYQLLDEREEQLMNKAGAESFHITIVFLLLSYIIAILAPSLFNPTMILIINIIGLFYFFNRARNLGATYYSRVNFKSLGCLLITLLIKTIIIAMVGCHVKESLLFVAEESPDSFGYDAR